MFSHLKKCDKTHINTAIITGKIKDVFSNEKKRDFYGKNTSFSALYHQDYAKIFDKLRIKVFLYSTTNVYTAFIESKWIKEF